MARKLMMLALPALAALAGCADQTPARPAARLYAVDLRGTSRVCTVPAETRTDANAPATVEMKAGSDGGWCGITVNRPGPQPYTAGLVETRPQHGRLHIHTVGDKTRIDYIADAGYAGADTFAVRLVPGNARVTANVTVEAVAAPAAAVTPPRAPTAPERPAARPAAPSRSNNRR